MHFLGKRNYACQIRSFQQALKATNIDFTR